MCNDTIYFLCLISSKTVTLQTMRQKLNIWHQAPNQAYGPAKHLHIMLHWQCSSLFLSSGGARAFLLLWLGLFFHETDGFSRISPVVRLVWVDAHWLILHVFEKWCVHANPPCICFYIIFHWTCSQKTLQQARGTPLYSQEDVDQDRSIKHLDHLSRFLVMNV